MEQLTVEFGTGGSKKRVVDQVKFSLEPGETLGLVGQSGSGKSMTALAIMGLLRRLPTASVSGSVRLDGRELVGLSYNELRRVRGDQLALIMQDPMASLNPAFTIGDQIAEAIRTHRHLSRHEALRQAIAMLERVEISAARRRIDSYPHEFSGGMRQRVMLAMALALEPRVLIADEPTTALDVTIQAQILDLLRSLQEELGMAILFITHDLGVVADLCDRVAVMYAAQLVETGAAMELFEHVKHPYTEELLKSTPEFLAVSTAGDSEATAVQADSDAFVVPSSGCRFAPRCPHRMAEVCEAEIALIPRGRGPDHPVRCVRAEEVVLENAQTLWEQVESQ